MPEGHTIHRLAAAYGRHFGGGRPVAASSPQGKFADGAALIDGQPLTSAEAHGKNLFLGFSGVGWVHIHLGLYGKVTFGEGPAPAPVGQVRLRLSGSAAPGGGAGWADLRGPSTCALITGAERDAVTGRLGPDPLRGDADAERAWLRVTGRRIAIAELLLDQRVVAGAGNIYRAEVLFRGGIDPYRPGRDLTRAEWDSLWLDLAALMREGVRLGRIDTVRPQHTPEAMGRPPRQDEHGGEVYVYRRAGSACHVCGTPVRAAVLAARNLFWCPVCQPR
ncbi:Fpg/Nei family DNA glycosylase [Streptomyces sp. SBT349]|uniref:Fpg/Nei family DNA glycosylase n=1 Tax=Streptomyces sp. SBT349 TaxID=1580539 RepID=UPI00066D333D|nr:DNA-formamidopyrimidine glycosylase family protein [Streptomyces sp. SBT349]